MTEAPQSDRGAAPVSRRPSTTRGRQKRRAVAERRGAPGPLGECTLPMVGSRRRHGAMQDARAGAVDAHRYGRMLEIQSEAAAARDVPRRVVREEADPQEADRRVAGQDAAVDALDPKRQGVEAERAAAIVRAKLDAR